LHLGRRRLDLHFWNEALAQLCRLVCFRCGGYIGVDEICAKGGLFLPANPGLREQVAAHGFVNITGIMAGMVLFAMATLRQAEIELQTQNVRSSGVSSLDRRSADFRQGRPDNRHLGLVREVRDLKLLKQGQDRARQDR
jgi:hypothetical protein